MSRRAPEIIRVGLVPPRHLDQPTGIVNYSRRLAEELARSQRSIDVVLLTRTGGTPVPAWCTRFEHHDLSERRRLRPNGGWNGTARRLGIDLIHVTGNIAPFFRPKGGVKRVVSVHDAGPLVMPGDRSVRERLIHAALIPPLRLTADAVLTISEASARDLHRYAGIPKEMVTVTHLAPCISGANADAVSEKPDGKFFLAVGDVATHKNLLGILEAFSIVRASVPDTRFVISGRMSYGSSAIREAAARLGSSVRFTGFIDDPDLDQLFRSAQALVFPSLHEGFGITVVEAMARGTPVITSNRSALPEVAGDAALLVDPYDVNAIAEAMLAILNDDALAADMRARGLRRAADFSWQRTAELTAGVYQRLMASPTPDTGRVGAGASTAVSLARTLSRGCLSLFGRHGHLRARVQSTG